MPLLHLIEIVKKRRDLRFGASETGIIHYIGNVKEQAEMDKLGRI